MWIRMEMFAWKYANIARLCHISMEIYNVYKMSSYVKFNLDSNNKFGFGKKSIERSSRIWHVFSSLTLTLMNVSPSLATKHFYWPLNHAIHLHNWQSLIFWFWMRWWISVENEMSSRKFRTEMCFEEIYFTIVWFMGLDELKLLRKICAFRFFLIWTKRIDRSSRKI